MDNIGFKLKLLILISGLLMLGGCGAPLSMGEIVHVETVQGTSKNEHIKDSERQLVSRIRQGSEKETLAPALQVISVETSK